MHTPENGHILFFYAMLIKSTASNFGCNGLCKLFINATWNTSFSRENIKLFFVILILTVLSHSNKFENQPINLGLSKIFEEWTYASKKIEKIALFLLVYWIPLDKYCIRFHFHVQRITYRSLLVVNVFYSFYSYN